MTIKAGIAANNLEVASTDTTLLNSSASERKVVESISLNEQTGAAETVELFVSTSATSAAGDRIATLVFAPNETKNPVAGFNRAIPSGSYLIAKGTTGALVGVNLTFTLYNGEDL